MLKIISENLRRRLQIGENGISQDYFNRIFAIHLSSLILRKNGESYDKREERKSRERVIRCIKKGFKLYTEYFQEQFMQEKARSNGDLAGLTIEDFLGNGNGHTVRRLDELAGQIKDLGKLSANEIDMEKLRELMYEISFLIYGESEIERLRDFFYPQSKVRAA